ncbi:Lactate dehydrogenase [Rubellimicrobium thermophilum DSM 16684]|uniref:Lactate dehydrogenase n=1 Tax=Rubellimicrobium thermophilum DSM 16684 TaxID=1123069 RepID=S9QY80_9RHOB|nr:SDR family NAD(P)-dependent oxidoreductase [Rubellimicrobium thermophilum]EPX84583.1 Lactate dehydrogenase [Rubellimicrobium thermophilum DSM 16684]
MTPIDLTGRTAFVTGGNRGIGLAAVRALREAGAAVTFTARSAEAAQDGERLGAQAAILDVTDRAALARALAPGFDILVNNAGVIGPIGHLADVAIEDWAANIATNLIAATHAIQLALPGMLARGGGTVVNLSSGAARNPMEGWSAYCAGKAGLAMVTRMVALEYGPRGIRVFGFAPGVVDTGMQGTIRASGINPVSRLPRESLSPPEEPGRAIAFLCTPAADPFMGRRMRHPRPGLPRGGRAGDPRMTDVVVTDATFPTVEAEERAARDRGASFRRAACRTAEEVAEALRGARVAVVQFAPLTRAAVEGLAPGARVIRYGVGYDNLDLAAIRDRGLTAAYVPDYCAEEVADHTAAMILALLRKLPMLDASVRRGEWAAVAVARPLKPFAETTVGFLGFGRIARGVRARLAPFGFRFLAHDPFQEGRHEDIRFVDRDTLLAESDALSLHAPSTEATRGLIGAEALARMRPHAVIVNTARGDLVAEDALAAALREGRIGGAALDVFAAEPLPADSPLRGAPNLLLSPHAAWYSEAAVARLQGLGGRMRSGRALDGLPPRCPIPGTAP